MEDSGDFFAEDRNGVVFCVGFEDAWDQVCCCDRGFVKGVRVCDDKAGADVVEVEFVRTLLLCEAKHHLGWS